MTAAPPTSELAAFIEARLSEDEAAARAAMNPDFQGESIEDPQDGHWVTEDDYGALDVRGGNMVVFNEGHVWPEQATHIARHDPARVLAEVAALRAVVVLAEEAESLDELVWSERGLPSDPGYNDPKCGERILRHLAAIWASNPAFNPAWSA